MKTINPPARNTSPIEFIPGVIARLVPGRPSFLFLFIILFACLFSLPLHKNACAATLDAQYKDAKSYYNNLINDKKRSRYRSKWIDGIEKFKKIYEKDRNGRLAPSCLFMLARMHKDLYGWSNNPLDLGETIAFYEDVVTIFSENRLADDSLYALGKIYLHEKKDEDTASRIFARTIALYPDGDMAKPAENQLRKLKKTNLTGPEQEQILEILSTPALKIKSAESKAMLRPLRHWSTDDYTRVVIETTAPVKFKDYILKEEKDISGRLYIELTQCLIPSDFKGTVSIKNGLLRQVRAAQHTPENVRVVLETESIDDYKIFSLEDPFRVVIDLKGNKKTKNPVASTNFNLTPDNPSLPQILGLGIRRVIIDPGHGGKDAGAVSPSGLLEKDVVLTVAKKTAQILRRELGCEVVLTRTKDVFVPLEERTAIANSRNGDLFISIHVNAAPTSDVRGIETYFLDFTDNQAEMRVAARENATSTGQMSDLQAILMDLIQNTKIQESAKLAGYVQESMVSGLSRKFNNVNNLGVKKAPFVVLVGAQMPAILAEIAFLSNPEEERLLQNDRFLTSVAEQLVSGVSLYMNELNVANLRMK